MGNVYERVTDNGNKKLVPAYIGIYKNDEGQTAIEFIKKAYEI